MIKHFKIIFYSFLFALCFTAFCRKEAPELEQPEHVELPPKKEPYFVKTEKGLNMRTQPNLKARVIITIPLGARLDIPDSGEEQTEINGVQGKWLKADYGKLSGWVFSGFLQKDHVPNLPDYSDSLRSKYCGENDNLIKCHQKIEKNVLKQLDSSFFKRSGKTLSITLQNGHEKTFVDQPNEEKGNVIIHSVLGFFDPIILIHEQFYEGDEFLGVDIRTGQHTKLYREPIFSPDKKRFLSHSSCNEPGYCFPGLRVERIDEDKLSNELSLENQLIIKATWKSDVEIELLMPPDEKSNKPRLVRKRLKETKWL